MHRSSLMFMSFNLHEFYAACIIRFRRIKNKSVGRRTWMSNDLLSSQRNDKDSAFVNSNRAIYKALLIRWRILCVWFAQITVNILSKNLKYLILHINPFIILIVDNFKGPLRRLHVYLYCIIAYRKRIKIRTLSCSCATKSSLLHYILSF